MGLDPRRVDALFRRFMADLGAALSAPLVVLGERLGLYRALAAAGGTGLTSGELALLTGVAEELVCEWLVNQTAGGYVEYDAPATRFRLAPEYAAALGDDHGLRALREAFLATLEMGRQLDRIDGWYRSHDAAGASGSAPDTASAALLRPLLRIESLAAMTTEWIPALAGVDTRLRAGGAVAELGCWDGWVTRELAAAYPRTNFVGFDPDRRQIDKAALADIPRNAAFRVGSFTSFDPPAPDDGPRETGSGTGTPGVAPGYDLIVSVDSFHTEPDPVAAAGFVRRRLQPDGAWMVVEPIVGRAPQDAIGPCGRFLTAAAATGAIPAWAAAAAANGGPLGARAGESKLRRAITSGGFGRVRRAAETPWHLVLEARP